MKSVINVTCNDYDFANSLRDAVEITLETDLDVVLHQCMYFSCSFFTSEIVEVTYDADRNAMLYSLEHIDCNKELLDCLVREGWKKVNREA